MVSNGLTIEEIRDAMAQADNDLPDGAYWAMVHDILGVEYGEVFPILAEDAAADQEDTSK